MATERSEGGSVVLPDKMRDAWWIYTGVTDEHVVALLMAKFPGSVRVRHGQLREWYNGQAARRSAR